jgi:hypothetical protein
LEKRRVVILAEAGSGKTTEFQLAESNLRKAGKAAFFVRIEDIADSDLISCLSDCSEQFDRWKTGTEDAWFFFDSIDEARVNRKNFSVALDRIRDGIGAGLSRARIILSCRVYEWRNAADRALIARKLPIPAESKLDPDGATDPEDVLVAPILAKSRGRRNNVSEDEKAEQPELEVVQLLPLDREERLVLAKHLGVVMPKDFETAVVRARLDVFTERPSDVIMLAEYWKQHGQFGAFPDMMNSLVAHKLRERDPIRTDNIALSSEEAMYGAERLAGALTLGKNFSLKTSNDDSTDAIDAFQVLPEWPAEKVAALLRRGVFAPASFGKIRFHHRDTQEFLTARWLSRLIENGQSRRAVWSLLFSTRYGVKLAVPSLEPVAAWLAHWHTDFLEGLLDHAPQALISHGDPTTLDLQTKSKILRSFIERTADGTVPNDSFDWRSLVAFADPDLSETVQTLWDKYHDGDIRLLLLRVIRDGRIDGCMEIARTQLENAACREVDRIVAAHAIVGCQDEAGLSKLHELIAVPSEIVTPSFSKSIAELLFPKSLSVDELFDVIERFGSSSARSVDGFADALEEFWQCCQNGAQRMNFIDRLSKLCLREPHVEDWKRVNKLHVDLADQSSKIAIDAVKQFGDQVDATAIVALLMVVERVERRQDTDDSPSLHDLINANENLKRALFWADVEEAQRNAAVQKPIKDFRQIGIGINAHWRFDAKDVPWLLRDAQGRSSAQDRLIAFTAAVRIAWEGGFQANDLELLRKVSAEVPDLADCLAQYRVIPSSEDRVISEQIERKCAERRAQRDQNNESNIEAWKLFRTRIVNAPESLSDSGRLQEMEGLSDLIALSRWLSLNRASRPLYEAVSDWKCLRAAFSNAVADAFLHGMKRVWRLHRAERPNRTEGGGVTTKWATLLCHAAVCLEVAEDPQWHVNLSSKDIQHAAEHLIFAEDYIPNWLDELLAARSSDVSEVLQQQFKHEWLSAAHNSTPLTSHFVYGSVGMSAVVAECFVGALYDSSENACTHCEVALYALQRAKIPSFLEDKLAQIADRWWRAALQADDSLSVKLASIGLRFLVDPTHAVRQMVHCLEALESSGDKAAICTALHAMFGDHADRTYAADGLAHAPVSEVETLIRVVYRVVNPMDDNVHEGSYTPDSRDHGERGRGTILSALLHRPGEDAFRATERLSQSLPEFGDTLWLKRQSLVKAAQDAELATFSEADIAKFSQNGTVSARTGDVLLEIVSGILEDVQLRFDTWDASSRELVNSISNEEGVQLWLSEQLRIESRGRFHVHREPIVLDKKEPDIIVSSTSGQCQVAIEIKHGGKRWSYAELKAALQNQLIGQYLQPSDRKHGLLFISHHKATRKWKHPADERLVQFPELVSLLSELVSNRPKNVRVVGLSTIKAAQK